ncbi:hypothetical protein AXH23_06785 [Acinetobacter pittii]|uniref:hypothetical protein n=1 Tax=Acinetobacter pittii TaxID=48296 RepID=UPI00083FDA3E|nr:hypothetical protein [Acinetobacter pittii]ODL97347.1 hypothetical protein AXH23_06785 [Acinetobacter pittii]
MKRIVISFISLSLFNLAQAQDYPNYEDEKKYLQMLEKVYPRLSVIVHGKLILNSVKNDIKILSEKDKKYVCDMANAAITVDRIVMNTPVHEYYFESTNYLQNFVTTDSAKILKAELQLTGYNCV